MKIKQTYKVHLVVQWLKWTIHEEMQHLFTWNTNTKSTISLFMVKPFSAVRLPCIVVTPMAHLQKTFSSQQLFFFLFLSFVSINLSFLSYVNIFDSAMLQKSLENINITSEQETKTLSNVYQLRKYKSLDQYE